MTTSAAWWLVAEVSTASVCGSIEHEVVETLLADDVRAAVATSARRLGPQEIDGSAVGLSREKRPQASPIGIEPLGSVPEPYEDLLDDVLGEPSIIKETPRPAEQAGRVSALDLGERVLLPASHRHREAAVASRGHIDLHLGRYPTPLVSRMTHLRAHDT
jgi:hypothetical protein